MLKNLLFFVGASPFENYHISFTFKFSYRKFIFRPLWIRSVKTTQTENSMKLNSRTNECEIYCKAFIWMLTYQMVRMQIRHNSTVGWIWKWPIERGTVADAVRCCHWLGRHFFCTLSFCWLLFVALNYLTRHDEVWI